jgi:hypothetical protein
VQGGPRSGPNGGRAGAGAIRSDRPHLGWKPDARPERAGSGWLSIGVSAASSHREVVGRARPAACTSRVTGIVRTRSARQDRQPADATADGQTECDTARARPISVPIPLRRSPAESQGCRREARTVSPKRPRSSPPLGPNPGGARSRRNRAYAALPPRSRASWGLDPVLRVGLHPPGDLPHGGLGQLALQDADPHGTATEDSIARVGAKDELDRRPPPSGVASLDRAMCQIQHRVTEDTAFCTTPPENHRGTEGTEDAQRMRRRRPVAFALMETCRCQRDLRSASAGHGGKTRTKSNPPCTYDSCDEFPASAASSVLPLCPLRLCGSLGDLCRILDTEGHREGIRCVNLAFVVRFEKTSARAVSSSRRRAGSRCQERRRCRRR